MTIGKRHLTFLRVNGIRMAEVEIYHVEKGKWVGFPWVAIGKEIKGTSKADIKAKLQADLDEFMVDRDTYLLKRGIKELKNTEEVVHDTTTE